ncbi:neuronal acetylcholine receptor subunit alpha-10-like isoform X2 [Acropora palmata]|uniref:neuronal acetylcholine receptor subunit alpha-10-like isoform X2 n=1 Tax=Acropora palmata TaxID=6131 RepID=UPI003DA183F6
MKNETYWRMCSKSHVYLLYLAVTFLTRLQCGVLADKRETEEFRLLRDLFKDYDKEVRPVYNTSEAVNVEFSLSLIQIISVNSKSQLLTLNVWIRQRWKNPMLAWNTSDYGGIESVNLDPSKVWIPDVILYNNADDSYGGGLEKYKTSVILKADGYNEWNAPCSFTSTCKIQVANFPFDKQNCSLKFGSWTFQGDRLTMASTDSSADLELFMQNGEWNLLAMPAKLNVVRYPCCKYPYHDVTLNLIIKRKPLYYVFNLILPCALISTLTLILFFLPPESGEKVGLGITVLLAMTVFLLLVAETLPATSDDVPLLGQYFIATMFVTAMSLVSTCTVLNFFHRSPSTSPMPRWVRVIILGYMAKVFCFKIEREDEIKMAPKNKRKRIEFDLNGDIPLEDEIYMSLPVSPRKFRDDMSLVSQSGRSTPSKRSVRSMSLVGGQNSFADRLLEDINTLADDVRARQEDERQREEWRMAALVLDRMFFWLFLFLTLLSTFLIFYRESIIT